MMPRAPIEPEGTFAGLRAYAIVFGAFVDIAATLIAIALLELGLEPGVLSGDAAAREAAIANLHSSNVYVVASLAIGALATALGAFVAAHRAGQLHVRHGGWVAVTSQAIGVLLMALQPVTAHDPVEAWPIWAEVTAWLLVLPAGVLGGALAAAVGR